MNVVNNHNLQVLNLQPALQMIRYGGQDIPGVTMLAAEQTVVIEGNIALGNSASNSGATPASGCYVETQAQGRVLVNEGDTLIFHVGDEAGMVDMDQGEVDVSAWKLMAVLPAAVFDALFLMQPAEPELLAELQGEDKDVAEECNATDPSPERVSLRVERSFGNSLSSGLGTRTAVFLNDSWLPGVQSAQVVDLGQRGTMLSVLFAPDEVTVADYRSRAEREAESGVNSLGGLSLCQ